MISTPKQELLHLEEKSVKSDFYSLNLNLLTLLVGSTRAETIIEQDNKNQEEKTYEEVKEKY